ncbi:hypothetical protein AcV7_006220 [Taiwanofungus camphoratus]|nr:hypothetical protein AcV7_006220 [Antrodia cinnamomea]
MVYIYLDFGCGPVYVIVDLTDSFPLRTFQPSLYRAEYMLTSIASYYLSVCSLPSFSRMLDSVPRKVELHEHALPQFYLTDITRVAMAKVRCAIRVLHEPVLSQSSTIW